MTMAETLAEIVNIPSVLGSEGRLCTALEERALATWGRDGVVRIGNSIVAGRRTGRPIISLYGHIDTVPEQGQGDAKIVDGRLIGLGSTDMKSGVAVMLHLMEDSDVTDGPYDVISVFYAGEEGPADENGLGDVLDEAPWLTESEFAVVLEPTDLDLHLGCQGVVNARVFFDGHAAHSSRPWLGENAITKAGAFLIEMHAWEHKPVTVDGLEYTEVFSVTQAKGGVARNIIPSSFELALNHRFPPNITVEEAEARLRDVAAAADRIEIVDRAPGASVPVDNDHLERLAAIAGTKRKPKQGWTDVARLSAAGVPAVNYGPGETSQAHQVGESVALANLDECYRVLKELLTN
ncbi:MAG: succinyl-diaminopimelate desuccinylase [Acidimicrobiia bacterium]|nr:succinyl-diaminopimelate desuccinylase [Acidimicrobiia bacterium]